MTRFMLAAAAVTLLTTPAAFAQDIQSTDASASDTSASADNSAGMSLYCIALYDYDTSGTASPSEWELRARRHAVEAYVSLTGVAIEQVDQDSKAVQAQDDFAADSTIVAMDTMDCNDIYDYKD